MRRYPIIILAFAAAAIAAACETDLTPTIAHIGAATSVSTTPRESLAVQPILVLLAVGGQQQLFTNAPDSLTRQLVWASQLPSVANVTQSGLVTAGTPGTTIVTVRYSFDTTNSAASTIQVSGPVVR